jgi:hypothetical protein
VAELLLLPECIYIALLRSDVLWQVLLTGFLLHGGALAQELVSQLPYIPQYALPLPARRGLPLQAPRA